MILLLLGIVLLVGVLAAGVAYGALRNKRAFAEQNEIIAGRSSRAPAAWAGAHSPEALLHRRLRGAVQAAAAQAAVLGTGFTDVVAAIGRGAEEIDDRLVAAAALPAAHRAAAIAAVEPSVVALENAVAGLSSAQSDQTAVTAALDEAHQRIAALDAARAEVDQADVFGTTSPAESEPVPRPEQQPGT